MKKATAVKGFVAATVLVFSIFNLGLVGSFYQWLVPTSSMAGQEVWLVLALVAAHYIWLALYIANFVRLVVKRIKHMNK